MPLYKYKAVDAKGGKAVEILIEGDSRNDSLVRLRGRGFTPINFLNNIDFICNWSALVITVNQIKKKDIKKTLNNIPDIIWSFHL